MNRIAAALVTCMQPMALCEQDSNRITSPDITKHEFYKKRLDCKGIRILGSEAVSNTAFNIACERLLRMTRHTNSNIHNNLIKNNVDFRLIAINESMTDLPEHSHMKNVKGGYSGKGRSVDDCRGMRHGSSVFCSEENLVNQGDKSKYSPNKKDIFIHETAHAIMGDGLDATAKDDIKHAWKKAVNDMKWQNDKKKAYALSNSGEYFAELSMWYFGGHGDFIDDKKKIPKPGPGGLAEHDGLGFKVLSNIYGGDVAVELPEKTTAKTLSPITGFEINSIQSNTGPMKHNKVSLSFKLDEKNNNEDIDYLVSWVNYKGDVKWGFRINKSCPHFKTNTFTGHAWLVQKVILRPRFYFFGKKIKTYKRFKGFIADKTDGICII